VAEGGETARHKNTPGDDSPSVYVRATTKRYLDEVEANESGDAVNHIVKPEGQPASVEEKPEASSSKKNDDTDDTDDARGSDNENEKNKMVVEEDTDNDTDDGTNDDSKGVEKDVNNDDDSKGMEKDADSDADNNDETKGLDKDADNETDNETDVVAGKEKQVSGQDQGENAGAPTDGAGGKEKTAAFVSPPEDQNQEQQQQQQQQNNEISWDDDEGNAGVQFFLFALAIGLVVGGIRNKEKILSLYRSVAGGTGAATSASKTTKYEQVASDDGNDEEWGWGNDDGDNDDNDNDNDDDDWGDDDWGDDIGTSNSKDIEMTTPQFSSNSSYNDTNITQRKPSFELDKETNTRSSSPQRPVATKKTSMALNGAATVSPSTVGGSSVTNPPISRIPIAPRSTGSSISATSLQSQNAAKTVPMPKAIATPRPSKIASTATTTRTLSVGATGLPQGLPGTIGGMTMGITSLGPKKTPSKASASKPKKKTLLGASDDDIFASMGFGGPPSVTKPKPPSKPRASPAMGGSGRWGQPPTSAAITTTPVVPRSLASASTPSRSTSTSFGVPPAPVATSTPAPAPIPDGFGDDDDLDLDLGGDGDDFGNKGGGDEWGSDDGDLDDLLFD